MSKTLDDIVEKHAWALYDPDSEITDAHMAIHAACCEVLEWAARSRDDAGCECAYGIRALFDDAPASEPETLPRDILSDPVAMAMVRRLLDKGVTPADVERVWLNLDAPASEPQPAPVDPWRALLEGDREKHAAVVRHHREQYLFDLAAKSREIVAYIDDLLARGPKP